MANNPLRVALLGPANSGKSVFIRRFSETDLSTPLHPNLLQPNPFTSVGWMETLSSDGRLIFVEYPESDFSFVDQKFDRIIIFVTRRPDSWKPHLEAAKKMVSKEYELFFVYPIMDAKIAASVAEKLENHVYKFSSASGKGCSEFLKELFKSTEERTQKFAKIEELREKRKARRKKKQRIDNDGWVKA